MTAVEGRVAIHRDNNVRYLLGHHCVSAYEEDGSCFGIRKRAVDPKYWGFRIDKDLQHNFKFVYRARKGQVCGKVRLLGFTWMYPTISKRL